MCTLGTYPVQSVRQICRYTARKTLLFTHNAMVRLSCTIRLFGVQFGQQCLSNQARKSVEKPGGHPAKNRTIPVPDSQPDLQTPSNVSRKDRARLSAVPKPRADRHLRSAEGRSEAQPQRPIYCLCIFFRIFPSKPHVKPQNCLTFHDYLSVLDEATIKPSDEKTDPRVGKNRWMRQS
jgi:hypothetical protein